MTVNRQDVDAITLCVMLHNKPEMLKKLFKETQEEDKIKHTHGK